MRKTIISIVHEFRDLSVLITVVMSALIAVEINILTSERELEIYIHRLLICTIISLVGWFYSHIWITRRYDDAKERVEIRRKNAKKNGNPILGRKKDHILECARIGDHMKWVVWAYLVCMLLSVVGTGWSVGAIANSHNISKANGTRIENCCKCLDCPYTQKITNDSHITTRDSSLPSNNYYSDSTSVVEPTIQIPERMTEVDIMPEVIDEPHIHP